MKKILLYSLLCYLTSGCNFNSKIIHNNLKITSTKVDKISVINKVVCSFNLLEKDSLTILNKTKIEDIILNINIARPISQSDIKINVQLGFFEINFNENKIEHSFCIIYTVYDGVIIVDSTNGNCYKNDELEIIISEAFMK